MQLAMLASVVAAVHMPVARTAAPIASTVGQNMMRFCYKEIEVITGEPTDGALVPAQAVTLHDITPAVNELVRDSGVTEGTVHCVSRHTTTALTINEMESVRDSLKATRLEHSNDPDLPLNIAAACHIVNAETSG